MKILKENAEKALIAAEKKLAKAAETYRENKNNIPNNLGKKFRKLLAACLEFLKEFRNFLSKEGEKIYEKEF